MQNIVSQSLWIASIEEFLNKAVVMVWGTPLVLLLCGTGLLLTLALGFPQFRAFGHAIDVVRGKFDDPEDPGEISHFQALCTALSATIGLGNIAGVAIAISVGGPGAVFWMLLVGLLGMATKFAECSLALMYRHIDAKGEVHGGPMYYMEKALGKKFKPMAMFFAVACLFSTFGASNMFQTYEVANLLRSQWGVAPFVSGLVLAVLTGIVILGGIRRIGAVTAKLVPFMGLSYLLAATLVIALHWQEVPALIGLILHGAFQGTAAVGGFSGAAVATVITQGVRRACFSNEAGIGSAPIAHAAASTKEPIREGVVALLEPFIDTILVCSMTALVLLISGVWADPFDPVTGKKLAGALLTAKAFNQVLPGFGDWFVPLAVCLFAYSTLLSWSYYGERSLDYLTGGRGLLAYKLLFCGIAFLGALWTQSAIIAFSDLMYGLMVIPNLAAVLFLLPKLRQESQRYFGKLRSKAFSTKIPDV